MTDILFRNFAMLEPRDGALQSGYQLLVRGQHIAELRPGAIDDAGARVVDLGGRTLMPGLIDCHVHIMVPAMGGRISAYPNVLPSFQAAVAGDVLRGILMRGFTTVRDAAGADAGHREAVEQGLFTGPRLFVCGRAISQTGGHGDARSRADLSSPCACVHLVGGLCRIADGVTEVRQAVRDEIRLGADQIKVMAGGGVASAADPIDQLQYSDDELAAAVDEAGRSQTYVLVHAYTADAIKRSILAGVRSIEHGNMIDEEAAAMMVRAGAFLVPTLITYRAHQRLGDAIPRAPGEMEKIRSVLEAGVRSLEIAAHAGVKMAFGTDCFRTRTEFQTEEFLVRAEVLKAADIIRSATTVAAEVLRMEGRLGTLAPGALADLIAVDGDPLGDLGLFQDEGAHIPMIMKDGQFYKNTLEA
jgi:imidazolonepropionase-like amidohydrolase